MVSILFMSDLNLKSTDLSVRECNLKVFLELPSCSESPELSSRSQAVHKALRQFCGWEGLALNRGVLRVISHAGIF